MSIVTRESLIPNVKDIESTLAVFVQPGGIGEIRVIGKEKPYGYYFSFDEIPQAAKIAWKETQTAKGVYVILNEIDQSLSDRPRLAKSWILTKDADIARRRRLLIDFDPGEKQKKTEKRGPDERGPDDSATEQEKERAKQLRIEVYEFLRDQYFPEPMFCDSGNGFHLVYGIDEPNDDVSGNLIKSFLHALHNRFSTSNVSIDISVHNAARITKLYGSVSRKGEDRRGGTVVQECLRSEHENLRCLGRKWVC